ncbi:MAG TPA: hypothetical protein VMU96_10960 [Casimicrobiaceae bacterium]|nr:hypothetical protein [Casimicrobiaceae bacterium]
MRASAWLPLCGVLVLAACADAPVQPPPPAPQSPAADSAAAASAEHRQLARRSAQAGDHATAAREWHLVVLLAPRDDEARREYDAERAAIRERVRENLQAGITASRNGDSERAQQAMLRVLALDPENVEAAKVLREIDRQRATRVQANQAQRAARETGATVANAGRAAPAPGASADNGESYDIEQPIEMFKAGDINGGLRDFRAFVDANPRNDAARQRIASVVYDRGLESEQKGAHEQALMLIEQALSLRGKPVPEWSAKAQAIRKGLAAQDKGKRAATDAKAATDPKAK